MGVTPIIYPHLISMDESVTQARIMRYIIQGKFLERIATQHRGTSYEHCHSMKRNLKVEFQADMSLRETKQ